MKISVNRPCSNCSEPIHYTTLKSYNAAVAKGTVCPSCRTAENNKSPKRDNKKENNPAWRGYGEVPGKVYSKLKRDAEKRNIPFDLTIHEINFQYVNQDRVCAFTGVPLKFGADASVDRINSEDGYNFDNIQIVHKDLNMMKKDMPNEVFVAWCKLVANHGKE